MLDVVFQVIEPKVEGDDAAGYRVTLQVPGSKNLIMYVVKEDGKYKNLDSSEKPNAIGLEIMDRLAAGNTVGARVLLDWVREAEHLAGGDDPLEGLAFPRMWTKGKDADVARMKLAAAAILAQTKETAQKGIPILEAALGTEKNETDKLNLQLALLNGYSSLEDYGRLHSIASELLKQYPESKRIFFYEQFALLGLGKFQEADTLAQDRLKRMPDDIDAMRALVHSATAREDYALAHERGRSIAEAGKAETSDLNGLAWLSLFTGKVTVGDVESAVKAARTSQNSDAAILHTLGCVYAETGKTKEAREVLIQGMDLLSLDEPNPIYWYAFGRIAEQYGEREIATADYARVTKPKKAMQIPESSYRLAQDRLKVLQSSVTSETPAKK
jgi:tetratricopeptide (TPR) repeat protein